MIKRGDTVKLLYADGEVIIAEIVHTPGGAGDSWQVRSQAGTMMLVNVYASDFIGMFKERSAVSCEHCHDGSLVWNERKGLKTCWICGKVADEPSS
jgi:hypothetical protein